MTTKEHEVAVQELDRVTIRFAGDSGDGMQVTGSQFSQAAAVCVGRPRADPPTC